MHVKLVRLMCCAAVRWCMRLGKKYCPNNSSSACTSRNTRHVGECTFGAGSDIPTLCRASQSAGRRMRWHRSHAGPLPAAAPPAAAPPIAATPPPPPPAAVPPAAPPSAAPLPAAPPAAPAVASSSLSSSPSLSSAAFCFFKRCLFCAHNGQGMRKGFDGAGSVSVWTHLALALKPLPLVDAPDEGGGVLR